MFAVDDLAWTISDGPPCMHIDTTENSLAEDILRGVGAIALFLGEPPRRVSYLCEKGYIPVGKEGDRWIASKATLRKHYTNLTRGSTADDPPTKNQPGAAAAPARSVGWRSSGSASERDGRAT